MIDDAFVFDCVAHVFNFDPKNAFGQAGRCSTTTCTRSTTR